MSVTCAPSAEAICHPLDSAATWEVAAAFRDDLRCDLVGTGGIPDLDHCDFEGSVSEQGRIGRGQPPQWNVLSWAKCVWIDGHTVLSIEMHLRCTYRQV